MPFNIARADFANILKMDSGITDWKEDVAHLENQLKREQIGCCDSLDFKQKKKDNRKLSDKLKSLRAEAGKVTGKQMNQIEAVDDDDDEDEVEGKNEKADRDFQFIQTTRRKKKRNIDVMGPITATADRLGLSVSQRCTMAATVANTLGVDIDDTNICRSSAWRRAREERIKLSNIIKGEL